MSTAPTEQLNLDFASYKSGLIEHLKKNPVFKDFAFEGSNLSVILDILAYNAYLQSYYHHMVASEMFLGTAQRSGSVFAHAEKMGYDVMSTSGSNATLTLKTPAGFNGIIYRGSVFSASIEDESLDFTLLNDVDLSGAAALSAGESVDVDVVQGEFQNIVFTETNLNYFPGYYTLPSQSIDHNSVRVVLSKAGLNSELSRSIDFIEDLAQNKPHASEANSFFWIKRVHTGESAIVIMNSKDLSLNEEALVAGSGAYAEEHETYTVSYVYSYGADGNGASGFSVTSILTDSAGSVDFVVDNPDTFSIGGRDTESVDSIKSNAPLYFQAQGRAVTESDYVAILSKEISEITSMTAVSGIHMEPKQPGRVLLSAVGADGQAVSVASIDAMLARARELNSFVEPMFIQPTFMSVGVYIESSYDKRTSIPENEITSDIRAAVNNFATENLGKFGSLIKSSRLACAVDNSSEPILGTRVAFSLTKIIDAATSSLFIGGSFENPIDSLTSSKFETITEDSTAWQLGRLKSRSNENVIDFVSYTNPNEILISNIGVWDSITGDITMSKTMTVNSHQYPVISITATSSNMTSVTSTSATVMSLGNVHVGVTGE